MPNPICHWELMVSDVARAKAFYGRIFDWTFDDRTYPGYTVIRTGAGPDGGLLAKPPMAPMPALNTYFSVASIDRVLRAVVETGGSVIVPKTELAGVGWFAMFLDPDRIPVGLLEQKV